MWEITYSYLVHSSVHIGHSISNSSPLCAWMVLAKRQQTLLINLYKWTFIMQRGIAIIAQAVKIRSPVWFVSLDPIKSDVVRLSALSCGEFYVVSGWISGLLSNYAQLCLSWSRNRLLIENARSSKHRRLNEIYDNWMLSRISWPRGVFLCGVEKSYRVARETLKALIPCIALADTVGGHQALSIAVPANDDTMDSIYFHNFFICKTILQKKFSLLFHWFYHIRSYDRLEHFNKWFAFRGLTTKSNHSAGRFIPLGRVSSILFSQPRILGSYSLLTALSRVATLRRNKLASQNLFLYKDDEHSNRSLLINNRTLSKYEICENFINNNLLYTSLMKLSFLASLRSGLTPSMSSALSAAKKIKRIAFSSKRHRTYLTWIHHLFDLLDPDHKGQDPESLEARDYLFKRGWSSAVTKNFMNSGPFAEKLQKILTSFFLVIGLFSHYGFTAASAYIYKFNYRKGGRYFRRLQREVNPRFWEFSKNGFGLWKNTWKRALKEHRMVHFRKEHFVPRKSHRGLILRNIFHIFLSRLLHLSGSMRKLPTIGSLHKDLLFSRPKYKTRSLALEYEGKKISIGAAKFFVRSPLLGKRDEKPLLHMKNLQTFANRIYWRFPLLKKEIEEAASAPESFPLMRKTNIRAKDYTYFMYDYWTFGTGLLADLYWGSPLKYMPSNNPLFFHSQERIFYQSQSYPLFKQSAFLLKCSKN